MKQEDKQQLLVKELCARQPWGVKVQYNNKVYSIDYVSAEYKEVKLDILDNYTVGISDVKPYLRPMSSMTEEEKRKYYSFIGGQQPYDCDYSAYPIEYKFIYEWDIKNYMDFVNANHLDYRGLIKKGLAIEVTEENNPYK